MILPLLAFLGGTITIENPGIRLELFLKELSKQTGETYLCSTPLNNEVLVASFKDQPIEMVKTQLSGVIHASWTKRENVWQLAQTDDEKEADRLQHREIRRQEIQARLDSLKPFVPKKEMTFDDVKDYLQYTRGRYEAGVFVSNAGEKLPKTWADLDRETPIYRLCANLSVILKPECFNLDECGSMVTNYYSNSELSGLRPIPLDYRKPLEQYSREVEVFRPASLDPSAALFSPLHLVINNEFKSVDVMDRYWRRLGKVDLRADLGVARKIDHEAFPISSETREFVSARFLSQEYAAMNLHPEVRKAWETLLQATRKDPLGIVYGRVWIDFAHYARKPLLANLSDSIIEADPESSVPRQNSEARIAGNHRVDADVWILATPIDPLEARVRREDRRQIQRFAQLSITGRNLTIDESAELGAISLAAYFRKFSIPGRGLFPSNYQQSNLLPVYGNLPLAVRSGVRNGISVPVSSLSNDALDVVRNLRNLGLFDSLSGKSPREASSSFSLFLVPDHFNGMVFEAMALDDLVFTTADHGRTEYMSLKEIRKFMKDLSLSGKAILGYDGLTIGFSRTRRLDLRLRVGKSSFDESILERPLRPAQTYTWQTLPEDIKVLILPASSGPPLPLNQLGFSVI